MGNWTRDEWTASAAHSQQVIMFLFRMTSTSSTITRRISCRRPTSSMRGEHGPVGRCQELEERVQKGYYKRYPVYPVGHVYIVNTNRDERQTDNEQTEGKNLIRPRVFELHDGMVELSADATYTSRARYVRVRVVWLANKTIELQPLRLFRNFCCCILHLACLPPVAPCL